MDKDFFLNAGLPTQLPPWKLMPLVPELNCPSDQSPVDRFESALSSMVSSPVSSSPALNSNFAIRELIGKLGSISNGGGDVSSATMAQVPPGAAPYNTPPPPKLNWLVADHFGKEKTPGLRNSIPFCPGLPSLEADPGFAERAAKFSCFGSRSFNGRTSQLGLHSNNPDLQFRSSVSPLMGDTKLPRVSSSPSLKINGSALATQEHKNPTQTSLAYASGGSDHKSNSNEESSVSEQMETRFKNPNDSNSRKRKAASLKGKAKETAAPIVKVIESDKTQIKINDFMLLFMQGSNVSVFQEEANDDLNSEKPKKTEDTNGETEKKPKITEPPKDYIHVRARRGQATDSHSLAERVRFFFYGRTTKK